MKKRVSFLLLAILFNLSSAQELKKEYKEAVSSFVACIENKNIEKLKTLVAFPIIREYPLSDIENERDFVKRYDEIFDNNLVSEIVNSDLNKDWSAVGWRGIMLNNGTLWLNYDGKLTAVNYQSNTEQTKRGKLIEADRESIHQSLAQFKQPILLLETETIKVRLDELINGYYRYAAWPLNCEMSNEPDLIIENGDFIPDGSGGNYIYKFTNDGYTYECTITSLGAINTPRAGLSVYKNDIKIIAQTAQIIKK